MKSELPKTQKPNPQTPRNRRGAIAHAAATEEPLISFLIGLRLLLFRLGRDEERDLTFGRVFLKMSEKFGGSSPAEFLEGFGEFSRHAHSTTGADFHKGREGFFEPMG